MNSNHIITIIAFALVFAGYFMLTSYLTVPKEGSDYDELFTDYRETFHEVVEILSNHPAIIRISHNKNLNSVKNASNFSKKDWVAYHRVKHFMEKADISTSTSLGDKGVIFTMPYPILNDNRLDSVHFLVSAIKAKLLGFNTLCRPLDINWYLCSRWSCSQQMEEEMASMGMSGEPLYVKQCRN